MDQQETIDSQLPNILESFGPWPVLKSWNKDSNYDLIDQLVKADVLGSSVFFITFIDSLLVNGSYVKGELIVRTHTMYILYIVRILHPHTILSDMCIECTIHCSRYIVIYY